MNKKVFLYFLVIIALLMGAIFYNNQIQSPIVSSLNLLKLSYHNTTQYIEETIDQHFFQAQKIQELKIKTQEYNKNHLVTQELANEINDLFKQNDSKFKTDPKISLIRTISYEKFGNFNRLWMDVPDYNASKIYGFTYNELVAGIIIEKNAKPLALLNRDIKSAYAVYVGNQSAPGVAHGNSGENLIVNFIPAWFDIQKGDEVVTSGLDNIFMKGLKVGRVLSVTSSQGYQNAIVTPYYKSNEPRYFYMIRSLK